MKDTTLVTEILVTPSYTDAGLSLSLSVRTERRIVLEDGTELASPPHRVAFGLDPDDIAALLPVVAKAAAKQGVELPGMSLPEQARSLRR